MVIRNKEKTKNDIKFFFSQYQLKVEMEKQLQEFLQTSQEELKNDLKACPQKIKSGEKYS